MSNDTETLHHTEEGSNVQAQDSSITLGHSMTLPGVYGSYSSHSVRIEITTPASAEELAEDLEGVVDRTNERIIAKQQQIMNTIADVMGKPTPFAETPAASNMDNLFQD